MNISDNVGWLEDFANESFHNGNTVQSERLWLIAKWITDADSLTQSQNELCHQMRDHIVRLTEQITKQGVRLDELSRENEYLQNRIARFGI
jgi:hypothetical protein